MNLAQPVIQNWLYFEVKSDKGINMKNSMRFNLSELGHKHE